MNLEIVRKLSENRGGGLKKLAADVGMSEQNLHRCIRNNKIQAADLEKIAFLLKADIRIFLMMKYQDYQIIQLKQTAILVLLR
ncbi:hypothetical protein NXX91_26690 [Bacteroides thetaiotaomicron]|nr:hypothetical protein [Bacteroides thetaiotaomicron]MCS2902708.1 hypothetical protein [Bacteroides thetaiotaomicron]